MIEIHPSYITKEGKREYVVLTYEEFTKIREMLEDYEDMRDLREAKTSEGDEPTIPLEELKAQLGMT